jgi:hypothetical protein
MFLILDQFELLHGIVIQYFCLIFKTFEIVNGVKTSNFETFLNNTEFVQVYYLLMKYFVRNILLDTNKVYELEFSL